MFKPMPNPRSEFSSPSTAAAASLPSAPGSAATAPTTNRSTATAPALVDRFADFQVPKLWSTWHPQGGKRAIVRALSPSERSALEQRVRELEIPTGPYGPREQDAVVDAVSAMFQSFRTMRQGVEEAAMLVDGLRHLLAPFPLWAIEQACLRIRSGEALTPEGKRLKREYAPNDSEIYGVVLGIVEPYRNALARAQALLEAPVESGS